MKSIILLLLSLLKLERSEPCRWFSSYIRSATAIAFHTISYTIAYTLHSPRLLDTVNDPAKLLYSVKQFVCTLTHCLFFSLFFFFFFAKAKHYHRQTLHTTIISPLTTLFRDRLEPWNMPAKHMAPLDPH